MREAARDGVPLALAWAVLLTPVSGAVALLTAYLVSRPAYYLVLQEDHPVEWLQFTLCLLTAALALAAAVHAGRRSRPLLAAVLVLGALAFLFLCLEEISWGQRVLGLDTPAALRASNAQDELNVHNVQTHGGLRLQELFKVVSFGLGLVGAVWTVLAWAGKAGASPLLRILTPPVYALPGFVAMALYWPAVPALPSLANPLSRMQEWVEVSLYIALAMTAGCVYMRARAWPTSAGSSERRATYRLTRGARRVPGLAGVVVLLITIGCAVATAHHGIVPGNVVIASLAQPGEDRGHGSVARR